MKKIIIYFLGIIIIAIVVILIVYKNYVRLIINGYSFEESKAINEKLNKNNINYVMETKKIDYLIDLINNKDFKEDNLEDYINLKNSYQDLSIDDVLYSINNNQSVNHNVLNNFSKEKNYNSDYLQRYLDYYDKYKYAAIDDIIAIVNNNLDEEDIDYSAKLVSFINSTYFIKDNTKRYLEYYSKNTNLSVSEVVSKVNANTDIEYYTNTQKTDISKDTLMLVNKYNYLDKNYTPSDLVTIDSKYGYNYKLRKEAYEAFKEMCDDALKENINLFAKSPFRSYSTQESLYNKYVAQNGVAAANRFSAKPGYSEHQTGLAVDIVSGKGGTLDGFESSMEYNWMQENDYKYGFILRYPENKEDITGYMFESWHYRYVGKKVAAEIHEKGITFDEYYAYYLK